MRWLGLVLLIGCDHAVVVDDAGSPIYAQAPYCTPHEGTALTLHELARGLEAPILVTAPRGDARLFIAERSGQIVIFDGSALASTPFIDIENNVTTAWESGLLGLAFHPGFADNGRFFIAYTELSDGALVVSEMHASPTAAVADPGEKILFAQPTGIGQHNGGMLRFGPDGNLYISVGDGGDGVEVVQNGQDPNVLNGKILRIDVDHGDPYAIPPTNLWARGGGRPEIYAWGFRNPWRMDVDARTGDVIVGDVGHSLHEEIDVVPGGTGGQNFGWPVFEANECFAGNPAGTDGCARASQFTPPVVAYDHVGDKCAVIGGVAYRGTCMPSYDGVYFYADYCTGDIETFAYDNGSATRTSNVTAMLDPDQLLKNEISSFGIDGFGELHMTSVTSGRIYRVELAP